MDQDHAEQEATRCVGQVTRFRRLGPALSGLCRADLREQVYKAFDLAESSGHTELLNPLLVALDALGGLKTDFQIQCARRLLRSDSNRQEADLPKIANLWLYYSDPELILPLTHDETENLNAALAEIRKGDSPFARAAAALLGDKFESCST